MIAGERPGRLRFPSFAALTTAAARLVLTMLEQCVTEAGAGHVFGDTDSMAVVTPTRAPRRRTRFPWDRATPSTPCRSG
jgi:hypothetical protein